MSIQDAAPKVISHQHQANHLEKLERLHLGPAEARPDAIIVPSSRDFQYLDFSVDLALRLRVPILILTTRSWPRRIATACLRGTPGAVAQLTDPARQDFFSLRVGGHIHGHPYADVGAKRNAGLRIARSLRWRTVLFLDDDISHLTPREVRRGAAALGASGLRAAAWQTSVFPDNSVVCHLRREVALDQGIFVGSGAMLVDLEGDLPFFPPVYNEDWLFMHDWLVTGRVGHVGQVRQAKFDPFDPARARRQEFGDVLAEGLFELMSRPGAVEEACEPRFWADVLTGRRQMLDEIRDRLRLFASMYAPESDVSTRFTLLHRVLQTSRSTCAALSPYELAAFVVAWRADLAAWNDQLNRIERVPDLATALEREGLPVAYLNP